MDVDSHLAQRVRELRKARGLTLAQLATASGVSRSMISLIERGEASATAAVLDKLADALGLSLVALFSLPERDAATQSEPHPLARRADQPTWRDRQSGYLRRQLSPAGVAPPIDLVEVEFPPGASMAFESATQRHRTHQQLWMLAGEMQVTIDASAWHLRRGDCLAMDLGPRIVFNNPGIAPARYLLALCTTPGHPESPR